jgi:hypothetical protein
VTTLAEPDPPSDTAVVRTIRAPSLRWRGRDYVADWMTGYVGRTVHIRVPDAIEVVDSTTGECLGIALLHDLGGL